jgi:hypothetical protein
MNLNTVRSCSIEGVTSWSMISIIKVMQSNPGFPYRLRDLQDSQNLTRNDMINVRRQIKKVNDSMGTLRFIEPDRTHVVYIDDSVKTEREIEAILASSAALIQINSNLPKKHASPVTNLTHYIYELLNGEKRL